MSESAKSQQADETKSAPAGTSKYAVYLLGLIAGLQMVDPAVANISLVSAGKELGFSGPQTALAASMSTLALAATVLASGVIADRIGRRTLLIGAMVLAAIGDVIAALTPITAGYMLGRALVGVGLGAALAATFAYVRFVAPADKVGAYLGLWNAVMMATLVVGSLIGSALAGVSWRVALLLVPVLALLLAPVALKVLPPMPKNKQGSVDYLGLIIIGASTVLFLFGASQAAKSLTAPTFLIPTALGMAGFALFAVVEAKAKSPAFPIRLFLQGVFLAAVIAGVGWNFAQATFQLASSNWWQYVPGESTFSVSVLQFPFLVTVLVGSLIAGSVLSSRPGALKAVLLSGFGLTVLGFLTAAVASRDGAAWWIVPGSVLIGLGLAAIAVPQSAMFVAAAPNAFFGAVTSFRTTVGQIGFALGLSSSVVLVQLFGKADFANRLSEANVEGSEHGTASDNVSIYLKTGEIPEGDLAATAIEQAERAYSHGFDMLMASSGAFLAVLGVLTWLALRRQARQTAEAQTKAVQDPEARTEEN